MANEVSAQERAIIEQLRAEHRTPAGDAILSLLDRLVPPREFSWAPGVRGDFITACQSVNIFCHPDRFATALLQHDSESSWLYVVAGQHGFLKYAPGAPGATITVKGSAWLADYDTWRRNPHA